MALFRSTRLLSALGSSLRVAGTRAASNDVNTFRDTYTMRMYNGEKVICVCVCMCIFVYVFFVCALTFVWISLCMCVNRFAFAFTCVFTNTLFVCSYEYVCM